MARRIQLRRDTAANWSSSNPTLAQGEIGIDLTNNKLKIGTGSTAWNSLSYFDDKETVLSNYAGHIVPSADNTYDLGAPDKQWRDIYVSDGSIYIGDIKMSNDGGQLVVQQVTNPGEETEAPVPDAPGVVTTDRLVHGDKEVVLGSTGLTQFPAVAGDSLFIQGPEIGSENSTIAISAKDNVLITADILGETPKQWQFKTDGDLQLPGGASLSSDTVNGFTISQLAIDEETTLSVNFRRSGEIIVPLSIQFNLLDTPTGFVGAQLDSLIIAGNPGKAIDIAPNDGANGTWSFGTDGNLQLPAGSDIVDSEGNSVLGGANTADITFSSGRFISSSSAGTITFLKAVQVNPPTGDYGFTIDTTEYATETTAFQIGEAGQPQNTFFKISSTGKITLPIGGDIVDSTGNSVLGGGSGSIAVGTGTGPSVENVTEILINGTVTEIEPGLVGISVDSNGLTDEKEVKVTVGNTDYFALVSRNQQAATNGVSPQAVAYDGDGNMITLHVSNYDTGNDKLIISKFSDTGELSWQKQLNNHDVDTSVNADLVIFDDNSMVITFTIDSYGVDNRDSIAVMKLDDEGGLVWSKVLTGNEPVEITESVTPEINGIGGITIEGTDYQIIFVAGSYTYYDGWVFQESTDGTNWTTMGTVSLATYDSEANTTSLLFPDGTFTGDLDSPTKSYRVVTEEVNSWHETSAITTDGDDVFVIAEYQDGASGPNLTKVAILKLAGTNGNLIWAKVLDAVESTTEMYGADVGADGHIVTVGYVAADGPGPTIAYINKFDGTTGDYIWGTVIGGNEIGQLAAGGDIVVDSQNNVFVTLNTREDIVSTGGSVTKTIAYIVKIDSTGDIVWSRRVGPGPCASVASGIDCDSTGNVYLSVLTITQDNPVREPNEFLDTGKTTMALAKYSTDGEVLWQRYIESDHYYFIGYDDIENTNEDYNFNYNRARNLSLGPNGKLAIQGSVQERDSDDSWNGDSYKQGVVLQIDQDGREMTIGSGSDKFTVRASRIPGKFVTLNALEGSAEGVLTDLTEDVLVVTPTLTFADAELAQVRSTSAAYEYVFGNDGTLTIPNDGDIKLTQTQIGWFSIFGKANNYNDDVWFRANCVDSSTGDVYAVGQDNDTNDGIIVRYNSQGQVVWSIKLNDVTDGNNTRCNAVKIHPTNGNVVVLCEYYGNQVGTLFLQIDPETARVVVSAGFRDAGEGGDAIPYDFAFDGAGNIIVVGRKWDEYRQIPVSPGPGSGVGLMIINKSSVTEGPLPITNSWYMYGTGITGRTTIQFVNRYNGLTGTVREGSGAEFTISTKADNTYAKGTLNTLVVEQRIENDGANTIHTTTSGANAIPVGATFEYNSTTWTVTTVNNPDPAHGNGVELIAAGFLSNIPAGTLITVSWYTGSGVSTAGTNYLAGHKIKVSGAQLGGTDGVNDAILTVTSVNGSGGITGYSITSGTATGPVQAYSAVSGTNYNVGSGFQIDIDYSNTTDYNGAGYYNVLGGTNYVVGDVITVLGTSLGGIGGGSITNITIATPLTRGDGNDYLNPENVTVSFADPNVGFGGIGTDKALGTPVIVNGKLTGINITHGGSGYAKNNTVGLLNGQVLCDIIVEDSTPGNTDIRELRDITTSGFDVTATNIGSANDMTVTVASVEEGVITDFTRSGTAQDTTVKIQIAESVDFGTEGEWSVAYALGGEAFVYKADDEFVLLWKKVLSAGGAYDTERYLSVAVGSDNAIYAAGEMIARNNVAGADLNDIWCAVVSKFASDGTHAWTKALNTTMNDSYAKCVSVQGTNTVVVSHSNSGFGSTVITKLDAAGNVKWQRETNSNDDSSVAVDTNGDIYAVVEAQFENRYENCIKLIKFNAAGEIAYRKFFGTLVYDLGGTNEYFKNGRNLTLDADNLYVSGYTTAFNDNYENSFLVKLPKDASCEGSYSGWVLQNDIYNVDKITSTEAAAFSPVIGIGEFEDWTPDFSTDWWDPSDNDEYHTLAEIVDRDGGAIEFADGTRQTSSAQQIPQRKIFNGADHRLQPEDSGKHIFVTNSDTSIIVPYDQDSPLPIGFTVVVINDSGGVINIDADGGLINIRNSSDGNTSNYWDLAGYGMATLIKVGENYWYISGNVSDDG